MPNIEIRNRYTNVLIAQSETQTLTQLVVASVASEANLRGADLLTRLKRAIRHFKQHRDLRHD